MKSLKEFRKAWKRKDDTDMRLIFASDIRDMKISVYANSYNITHWSTHANMIFLHCYLNEQDVATLSVSSIERIE